MKKGLWLLAALLLVLAAVGIVTSSQQPQAGKVYYLNYKPEADAAWKALAQTYTQQTGVEVKVVTAASGTYEEALTVELDKGRSAPTLFQVSNREAAATWVDFLLDLNGTPLAGELTTGDYNLYGENGELLAVGYCYEAFGLIANRALLQKAGYTVADINDFASLKAVAEDIHARREALGFDAFTPSGLDGSSSWRFTGHLANLPLYYEFRDRGLTEPPATLTGAYLPYYKNIWDLYIHNATADPVQLSTSTGDMALEAFGTGRAVFYQNGTWEYANLTGAYGMDPNDLVMLPIYAGVPGEENSALASGTENRWAVNRLASEADQQATLDFLYWVVTSQEGTTLLAEQFGLSPFKAAKASSNVFFADLQAYRDAGKYQVDWTFTETPNSDTWRAGVEAALIQYTAGTGSWADVEAAFVQGWAIQYAN